MEKVKSISIEKMNDLPTASGVYLFYEKSKIIYIGKAIHLRERVKNHFQQPSYRDNLFIKKVTCIGFIETDSEIEALVLEAQLIKKYLPRFNVVWRDNKNYFYVAIAGSQHPYVFLTHQKNNPDTEYIGPFVEGNSVKKTLKYLRRVFPYYTAKTHPKVKCTWCHLDLCPGPDADMAAYKKSLKQLALILKGKRNFVLKSLRQEMNRLARQKQFEEAAKTRDRFLALERIMGHARVIEAPQHGNQWQKTESALHNLLAVSHPISRMECYDISNIQGKQAVGSMVVFTNGKPDKSQYRKFRIRMENEPNDIAMLSEVITRRLKNDQWPYAEVMLIDGGIAQLNVAIEVKHRFAAAASIKIISIAKGRRELFIEDRSDPVPLKHLPQEVYNLIVHLDDEAHRFAVTYHKKLRKKYLLQ